MNATASARARARAYQGAFMVLLVTSGQYVHVDSRTAFTGHGEPAAIDRCWRQIVANASDFTPSFVTTAEGCMNRCKQIGCAFFLYKPQEPNARRSGLCALHPDGSPIFPENGGGDNAWTGPQCHAIVEDVSRNALHYLAAATFVSQDQGEIYDPVKLDERIDDSQAMLLTILDQTILLHVPTGGIGDLLVDFAGILKDDEYGFKTLEMAPNSSVVDMGAHCGLVSILCLRVFAGIHVYAFEPIASTFFYLKWNLLSNLGPEQLKHMHAFNGAVCTDDRQSSAAVNQHSLGSTLLRQRNAMGSKEAEMLPQQQLLDGPWHDPAMIVSVQCIDFGAFKDLHLRHAPVGLVKIDCEGCEIDLLSTHSHWLETVPGRVVGESHLDATLMAQVTNNVHVFFCGDDGERLRPFFMWPLFRHLPTPDAKEVAICIPRKKPTYTLPLKDMQGSVLELNLFDRDLANPVPTVTVYCIMAGFEPVQKCIEDLLTATQQVRWAIGKLGEN